MQIKQRCKDYIDGVNFVERYAKERTGFSLYPTADGKYMATVELPEKSNVNPVAGMADPKSNEAWKDFKGSI